MGNKILGKRSRNFYKGFNERQVNYIKDKFDVIATNKQLDKNKFMDQYKLSKNLADKFFKFIDYDNSQGVDEYEFICAVHSFCNMTVGQLGQKFFQMIIQQKNSILTEKQLLNFTQVCMKYNGALQNKNYSQTEIKKINKDKFKKYDYDKNLKISKDQFISICTKDQDYKQWFYNMGFITKNQFQFNDQVYDLVDSDVDQQIQRHLTKTDPKVDKLKRGYQHKIPDQNDFQIDDDQGDQSAPPPSNKKQQNDKNKQSMKDVQAKAKSKTLQPWQKFIKNTSSQIDITLKQNKNSPSQTLTMKHIFGYRSYDCRNNIKFDNKGNIIYHQGSIGIVMNKKKQQSFLNEHKDDIVCLDVNENLVVTGEMGTNPSVMLWHSTEEKIKSKLTITQGFMQSIGNVSLSRSSQFLAVNCNDSDHTLFLFTIQKDISRYSLKCKSKLSKNAILDLKFSIDSKLIVAATLKQILFVKSDNSIFNASRGEFGQFSNACSLCLLPLKVDYKNKQKNWILSGMTNGSIYCWQQDKCKKAISGHNGSVSALAEIKGNGNLIFVSGDKSGNIIAWDRELKISHRCSIMKSLTLSNMIVSLSLYGEQILVGTKSSTVYRDTLKKQLILSDKNAIMYGHSEGNLWGLTTQQTQKGGIFYTGGQDQRLMKWQFGKQNRLMKEIKCNYKIRSLSHSSMNNLLAVGYINGVIQIFSQQLVRGNSKYDKIKNPDKQILNLVKFSGDGKLLAACYTFINPNEIKKQDLSTWSYGIIIFSLGKGQLKKQKQIDSESKIVSFDFDVKGQYLRLNTSNFDYKMYNIKQKPVLITNSKTYDTVIQKLKWQTHTTVMSPETRSFKTEGVQEFDIVCCERNRKERNVFLVGDRYSKIKLFNYPCIDYPIFNKYEGHSNSVTGIEFCSQDKTQYVISIGGQQKSIIVWQYDPDIVNNAAFFNDYVVQRKKQQIISEFQTAKGQESLSTNQYKGQIKPPGDFKTKYNARRDNKLPDQDLSIQHVFGIRNQYLLDEVRNMCRFTKNDDHILFPTACLGVKMNIKSKKQKFYHQHKQDIVSFAVDTSRNLMATGQMAQKNTIDPRKKIVSICIWDVENHKLLKKLDGFHTIAVVLLEFSPSGKLLFSVGNDSKNTYAVYDWKAGSILYSGPISGGKVNGVAWKNQSQFITCGNDHVKFWDKGKGKQGKFGDKMKLQSMFSCIYYEDKDFNGYITGGGSGTLFVWKQNISISATKAHGSSRVQTSSSTKSITLSKVQTIVQRNKKIYTGGDDGLIKSWKLQKNCSLTQLQKVFDPRVMYQMSQVIKTCKNSQAQISDDQYGILSIDFSNDKDNALIVTKGATVILLSLENMNSKNKQVKIVHQGHYKGQLWGLATYLNSKKKEFIVTGGDDCTVRIWDLQNKQEVSRIYLDYSCRAVDCYQSNDLKIVAADKKAQLYLIDKNFDQQKYTGKPFQKNQQSNKQQKNIKFDHYPWVEDIKFSPSGDKICYGTHGQSQFVQVIPISKGGFSKKQVISFKAGSSAVNHIDWSRSGDSVAINTQAWQYLFFNVNSNKQNSVSASALIDERWATYTRKYGFQSQGVFQSSDHSDINTVCRFDLGQSKGILAAGYDDQAIRLFKYPCYIPKQVHKVYYGHSSHVTKIKFTNSKMTSIGGLDRTLIIWNISGIKQIEDENSENDEGDGLDDLDQEVDVPARLFKKKQPTPVQIEDFTQIEDEGDEFMAIKPWVGAIKQPSYFYPKSKGQEPNISIELSYVIGYRAKDCRQNLFYKNQDTVVFHAAAVLIELNIQTNQQKIFNQHNDDILSIDFHKQRDIIVTGQIGPKPLVCVYQQSQFLYSFKAIVKKGVIAISISPNGKFVVCVGMDDEHGIAVIDLQKKKVIKKQKGPRKLVTKAKWIDDKNFVLVGINYYSQWNFSAKGIDKTLQKSPKANNISLDIYNKGQLILVGSNFCSLYDYTKNKQGKSPIQSRQQGVIECIKITDRFVAYGTRNGDMVFLEKNNLKNQQPKKINLSQLMENTSDKWQPAHKSQNICIRSIDFKFAKKIITVLVGTLGSEIYQFNLDEKFEIDKDSVRNILKCHYSPNPLWTNQVWGLCLLEQSTDFIFTCSDDSTIRVYDISETPKLRYCLNIDPNQKAIQQNREKRKIYPDNLRLRSIGVSPNQKYLVVGAFDGTLRIFDLELEGSGINQRATYEKKIAKQWVSDIKFGYKTLIVGSHDDTIYVFDFQQGNDEQATAQQKFNLKLKYKPMKKHSSYITHLDVSRDSCFLQSTCGAYEILFWDLNSGKQLPGGATMLKNQKWKTWTCNLGWPVQGIYPKQQDGTFINAVDRSNTTIKGKSDYTQNDSKDFYLLAAGNDHGKVAVYNYPCLIKNSNYVQGRGHSSHVTTVRWTCNDKYIVSVGGQDQCIMIWKIDKSKGNTQQEDKNQRKQSKLKSKKY